MKSAVCLLLFVTATSIDLSVKCDACEFVVSELEKLINAPSTMTDIEKFLIGVCDELPTKEQPYCYEFVTYADTEKFSHDACDELPKKEQPHCHAYVNQNRTTNPLLHYV